MQTTKQAKISSNQSGSQPNNITDTIFDYSEILASFNTTYDPAEYYWQVGGLNKYKGWILHLSAVTSQIPKLLEIVLPTLIQDNITFKIVRNKQIAYSISEGQLGFDYLNKLIVIYPASDNHALQLAIKLISLTNNFKGPSIPTDRWLGAILYTQFCSLDTNTNIKQYLPYAHEQGLSKWPFTELASENTPRRGKLLNSTYYPIATIKKDAKGDVIKALYFKKFYTISSCVIKQGRKHMLFDDFERDVRDRLKWQYQAYGQLAGEIDLPKVIDFFEENDDTYLVMEFLRGTTVTTILNNQYKGLTWFDLPYEKQIRLIEYLSGILSLIGRLHKKGFIHRDITPENFLVTNDHRIWMLDTELMWSSSLQKPNPPFESGTPGFMSPEQQKNKTPTIKDDIYALGAFLLTLFTNFPPIKFSQSSKEQLIKTLSFFIGDENIANLIGDCLSENPLDRPDLEVVRTSIALYYNKLQQKVHYIHPKATLQDQAINDGVLKSTIQSALQGLANGDIMSPQGYWLSNINKIETDLGNEQTGLTVYPGWHTGMAGPLWLLGIAKEIEFDIQSSMSAYKQSVDFLDKHYHQNSPTDGSLYTGQAGIALAISEGFTSSLLHPENSQLKLEVFFSKNYVGFGLAEGLAGQGIALLDARRRLSPDFSRQLLNFYIQCLLDHQSPDGAWNLNMLSSKKENLSHRLDKGIPGIIWFLLHFLDYDSNTEVLASAVKALKWLINPRRYKAGARYNQPLIANSKSGTQYSTNRGIPGITLVLIKAFQITNDNRYRTLAEMNLNKLPDRLLLSDFTLSDGLVGIGEIYLEAYKVFKDPKWLYRAEWIAKTFIHSQQFRTSGESYWITRRATTITADLSVGNAGIIHFLMHYLYPDKLQHPLAPRLLRPR